MKKFLLLLIRCFTLIGLTGCSVQGTWKFEEKTAEVLGFQKTYKIGDKDALGKEITEDYLVIEFNKDGTGTLTQAYVDGNFTFTWTEEDKVITAKGDLVAFEAEKDGSTLIVKFMGETYKLKK